MNDVAVLFVVLMAGVLLGTIFFGGLWWTVRSGLTSNYPALWFFGSTLLRTGFAVTGFYLISNGDWIKFLVCLLGFFIARIWITWLTRTAKEELHAP